MSLRIGLVDEAATRRLGMLLAAQLNPGDVVLLSGELGSGKTTMTQGLLAGLGVTQGVTSPTFSLCHLYDTVPRVAHVDCWRLETPRELVDLALDEFLEDGGVAVIEWGERAAFLFDESVLSIELARDNDRRIATLSSSDARWTKRLSVLPANVTALEGGP